MDFAAARALTTDVLAPRAEQACSRVSQAVSAGVEAARQVEWRDVRVPTAWNTVGHHVRQGVRANPHTALAVAAVGGVLATGVAASVVRRRRRAARAQVLDQSITVPPVLAPYPGPNSRWDRIEFGVLADGSAADMRLFYTPHALLLGATGSGKSITARNIITHCLVHADDWQVVAIDFWKVELSHLRAYANATVHTSVQEAVIALAQASAEMERRYLLMEDAAVMNYRDLPAPPKAILVHVDEMAGLAPQPAHSDADAMDNFLRAESVRMLEGIARLGRAAGIHLLISAQRADTPALTDDLLANLDLRIVMGRYPREPLARVLPHINNAYTPSVRGRGLVCARGDVEEFQSYFCPPDWYDEHLAAQEEREQSIFYPISLLRTPSGVVVTTGAHAVERVTEAVARLGALDELTATTANSAATIAKAIRSRADVIGYVGSLDDPKVIDRLVWAGSVGCVVYVASPGHTYPDLANRLRSKAEGRGVGCEVVADPSV